MSLISQSLVGSLLGKIWHYITSNIISPQVEQERGRFLQVSHPCGISPRYLEYSVMILIKEQNDETSLSKQRLACQHAKQLTLSTTSIIIIIIIRSIRKLKTNNSQQTTELTTPSTTDNYPQRQLLSCQELGETQEITITTQNLKSLRAVFQFH